MEAVPPRAPVYVEGSACAAAPLGDIVGVLRVELAEQLTSSPPPAEAYRIAVDCVGERAIVTVIEGTEGVRHSYETDLTGTPATVRPRVVALAIAEIVRELDHAAAAPRRPEVSPSPAVAPERSVPSPEGALAPILPTEHAARVSAYAQASAFRLVDPWLLGGGVGVERARGWLSVGLDGVALTSQATLARGTTRAFLAYGDPYIAWRVVWGLVEIRLGAGVAVGVATLTGRPADARSVGGSVTGVWVAPDVFGGAALRVTEGLEVGARAQLGWVARPIVGEVEGAPDQAVKGTWLSVLVGAAVAFGR